MAVNRILYFYLLLLTFLFFVLFDVYLFHLLFLFLLLLPVLSLLAVLPVRRAVRCKMEIENEIVPRGRCQLALTTENLGVLPCARVQIRLSYHNALGASSASAMADAEETVQLSLPARQTRTLRPLLKSARCGRIDFAVRRVYVCDLLCLLRLPIPARNVRGEAGSVYVLPAPQSRTIAIEEAADIGADSTAYSQEKPGGDPSEIFQLRDYREGDSLRSVHWKLSSRMQRLIVREFGLPLNPSLHFLMELRAGAAPAAAEAMLGTMLAFSEFLLSREIVHSLSFVTDDGVLETISVTSTDTLAAALHSLLALPGQKRWSTLHRFTAEAVPDAGAHLVYLLAGADWNDARDAEAEQTLGSVIDLAICRRMTLMPDVCPPETADRLRALGLEVQLLDGRIPASEAEALL